MLSSLMSFPISIALTAANEMKNEDHESDDKQDMDESAGNVKRKSTAPEQQ